MMSSSSPSPVLPISNLPSTSPGASAATGGGDSTAPIVSPAFRLFITRISDYFSRSLSNRRSWSELGDRTAFSRPENLSDAISRLRKNLSYFRVNYAAVVAAILALSLVTHPFSLLVLFSLLAAWCLLYLFRPADHPLVLFGRNVSDHEALGGLVLLSVFVVFLTSVGSLLISALVVGTTAVCAHGAFRVPEDLFLDEQEPAGPAGGLLSFIGGSASSIATTGPAIVAARV